jgi:hypothetical protein
MNLNVYTSPTGVLDTEYSDRELITTDRLRTPSEVHYVVGVSEIAYNEEADLHADDINDLGIGRHDNKSLMNRKDKNDLEKPRNKEPPILRWLKGDDGDPKATLTAKKPRLWPPIFVFVVILAEVGLFVASVVIGGFDSYLNNSMVGPPMATLIQLGAKVVSITYSIILTS